MTTSDVASANFPRVRFTLAQLLLLVALAGILISLVISLFANEGRVIRSVSTIVFLPGGNQLATAAYSWRDSDARDMKVRGRDIELTVEVLDLNSQEPRLIATGALDHQHLVSLSAVTLGACIAYSPRGHLAVARWDGPVHVHDVESGKLLTTFWDRNSLYSVTPGSTPGTRASLTRPTETDL